MVSKNKPKNKENRNTSELVHNENPEPGQAKQPAGNKKKKQSANVPNASTSNPSQTNPKAHQSVGDRKPGKSVMKYTQAAIPGLPCLLPTSVTGCNLSKRILSDVYRKELNHTLFLVWVDSLYSYEQANAADILSASSLIFRKGTKKTILLENIFVNAIKSESAMNKLQPAGSCFVMIPTAKVNEDEVAMWQAITKARVQIMKVSIAMLRQHMMDGRILLFNEGYAHIFTESPQYLRLMKLQQEDLSENRSRSQSLEPAKPQVEQAPKARKVQNKKALLAPEPVSGMESTNMSTQQRSSPNGPVKPANPVRNSRQLITNIKSNNNEDCDSDVQIIESPMKTVAIQKQVPVMNEPDQGGKEFIPVTAETLPNALALMNLYENQKRAVVIVFDPCFFLEDIKLALIRDKFKAIFGHIEEEQVLIRVNMPMLAKDLADAKRIGMKTLNQAYIIGPQGMTVNDVDRKAAAKGVFCCPMTMACVVNNLRRGVFLMHRNVLLSSSHTVTPKRPSNNEQSNNITELNISNNSNDSSKSKAVGPTRKRNRIAATLGGVLHENNEQQEVQGEPVKKPASAVAPLLQPVDENMVKDIMKYGDCVLRINNLPAKLTVRALNLMLGTFTLKAEQILASIRPGLNGKSLMDVRIVIKRENEDVNRILNKNGCKTCYNTTLEIDICDHEELRNFICSRACNLMKLDSSTGLPVNRIGYSNAAAH